MVGGSFLVAVMLAAASAQGSGPQVYSGICDGSAVAMVGSDRFVTMSDENPAVYSFPIAGGAGNALPLNLPALLGLGDKEGDFEAAARIGDTIYWIASFGATKKAKEDPTRRQFFATSIAADGTLTVLGSTPGENGKRLFAELIKHSRLVAYDWLTAITTAPKMPGGISIEGLAATPSGTLIIGFRNSPPKGRAKALVLTLSNPAAAAAGATPILSDVTEIDLGGRGIRDIVYRPAKRDFLIIAGAIDKTVNFALYKWDGKSPNAKKITIDFGTLNPEALTVLNDGRLFVVSDDGELPGRICKDMPEAQKQFRGVILPPPD